MPVPLVEPMTEPYWTAAREGRLVIQRCTECGTFLCVICNMPGVTRCKAGAAAAAPPAAPGAPPKPSPAPSPSPLPGMYSTAGRRPGGQGWAVDPYDFRRQDPWDAVIGGPRYSEMQFAGG
jgi:hypothetical protein